MRWSVYILAVLLAVAFDSSLGAVLEVSGAQPRLLPCVVVFALLAAPRGIAVRAAMLAGLVADLLSPAVRADGTQLVVIGPWVLGFALGSLAVVPLRSLLYRRNAIAGGFATLVFCMLAAVAFVMVWVLRILLTRDDSPAWWPGSGAGEVWIQTKSAMASAVLALPALWLLEKTRVAWGFSSAKKLVPGAARETA